MSSEERSVFERRFNAVRKSEETTAFLAYLLFFAGAHRFYLGQHKVALTFVLLHVAILFSLILGFALDINVFKALGGLLWLACIASYVHDVVRHVAITEKENWRRRSAILDAMAKEDAGRRNGRVG
jgi:TM2 domain-containing membrane protein YozV